MKPKEFTLFGRTYKIVCLGREDDDFGIAQYTQKRIGIKDSLCWSDAKRALLHEVFHMALLDIGRTEWDNEDLVGALEFVFFHALRENRELFEWIQEE